MTVTATGQIPDPQEQAQAHEPAGEPPRLTIVRDHQPSEPDGDPEPDGLSHEPEPEPEPEPELGPEPLPAFTIPDLRAYADPKAALSIACRGVKASRQPAANLGRKTLTALKTAALAVLSGSVLLLSLIFGWMTGAFGKGGSVIARIGTVLLAGYGIARTIGLYPVQAPVALVAMWCTTSILATRGALKFLTKHAQKKPKTSTKKTSRKDTAEKPPADAAQQPAPDVRDNTPDGPTNGPPQTAGETATEDPLTALIRDLTGNENGVHLQTLRPAMRKRLPGLEKATDKELREMLVTAGFDPSRTFRARGVAGRAGVHRDQLPQAPTPESGTTQKKSGEYPAESATDLGISPPDSPHSPPTKSGQNGHQKTPSGWTREDIERGHRIVNDPTRGPAAWRIEYLNPTN